MRRSIAVEKDRAKRIIIEVIRQAGGSFERKTNLYKAFYHAHLKYAGDNPGYLSRWPIVRMPNGPGIDNFDSLVGELLLTGVLHVGTVMIGDKEAVRFELTVLADSVLPMEDAERGAIKFGVDSVAGKTAKQVSKESHDTSRAWRAARDGEELDIYADLSSDEEHDAFSKEYDSISTTIDAVFGSI